MFRHAKKREDDLEGNIGEAEILDFEDSSWILDHHRPNFIQKITKPENAFGILGYLWNQKSATGTKAHNNHSHSGHKLSHSPDQEIQRDSDQQLGRNNRPTTAQSNHARLGNSQQSYRINLCELQRFRLRQLQHKLVRHVVDISYDADEPCGWTDDLRQYSEYNNSKHHCCSLFTSSTANVVVLIRLPDSSSSARLRLYGAEFSATPGSLLRLWRADC
jgi:hypothetical protein